MAISKDPEQLKKDQEAERLNKLMAPDEVYEGEPQGGQRTLGDRVLDKGEDYLQKKIREKMEGKKEAKEEGKPEAGEKPAEGAPAEGAEAKPVEVGAPKEAPKPGAEPTGLGEKAGEAAGKEAGKEIAEKGAQAGAEAGTKAAAGAAGTTSTTAAAGGGTAAAAGGTAAAGATTAVAGGEAAVATAATPVGWIILAGCLILVAIIIIILAIALIIWATRGGAGQSLAEPYNPNNPEHQKVLQEVVNLATKDIDPTSGKPKLEIPSKELDFLKNGFQASQNDKKMFVDIRLLKTMSYLGKKHNHIKIDHIIYPYIYMPIPTIETKSTAYKSVLANISAHKLGKALDISEIDYIYSQCTGCCDDKCKNNIKNYWWIKETADSHSCSMLCTEGCTGDKGPICSANLELCKATVETCSSVIPIQISWQDDPSTGFNFRGIGTNQVKNQIFESIGIQPNMVNGKSFKEVTANIGQGEFENYFSLENGSLNSKTLPGMLEQLGKSKTWTSLDLPYGSYEGDTVSAAVVDTGQAQMEEILGLPNESINGSNISDLFDSIAKNRLAKELGRNYDEIDTPQKFANVTNALSMSDDDLRAFAESMGVDSSWLVNYKNGDVSGIKHLGARIFENSLGIKQDGIWNYLYNRIQYPNIDWPEGYQGRISEIENQYDLDSGQFQELINTITNQSSFEYLARSWGERELSKKLGMPIEQIRSWANGNISFEAILNQNGTSYGDYSISYGLDENTLRQLFGTISTGPIISSGYQNQGSYTFGEFISADPASLLKYAQNKISTDQFISDNDINFESLGNKYGFESGVWEKLLNKDVAGGFSQVGSGYLKQTLGLSDENISNLIATNDYKILADNQVIKSLADAEGLNANSISGIMVGKYNPASLATSVPGLGISGFAGSAASILGGTCQNSFQNAARNKVHKVIKELLQFPDVMKNNLEYRITQIITYSYNRDVLPFENGSEKPALDDVYSKNRLPNYGLFTITDNNGKSYAPSVEHIHWAY